MKADLTRAANQLLRKLNREVFQDSIDISKLGIGVGLVEDFAEELLADRVSVGEPEIRELLCQKCGRDYPVWFAPNELWNRVAEGKFHFLCMDCFGLLAESQGIKPTAWMLTEENIDLSMALEKIRRLKHPELGPSLMETGKSAVGEGVEGQKGKNKA